VSKASEQAQQYGYSYNFMKSDPSLWATFQKAIKGNWDAGKFQTEIKNTAWYKKNAESIRQYSYLKNTDPATFAARIAQSVAQVRDAAASVGAVMSDAQIRKVAENSLQYSWNDSQIRDTLAGYVKAVNGIYGGDTGDAMQDIATSAWRNGIKVSPTTMQTWAQGIANGTYDADKVKSTLRQQAKGLAPAYAAELDAGMDLFDITSAYRESMASILEVNPADVDLFDPTIRGALSAKGKDGRPASVTLWQFEQDLRKDPRWKKTKNAQDTTMAVGKRVLEDFGFKAV